jgi:hypothetical protein
MSAFEFEAQFVTSAYPSEDGFHLVGFADKRHDTKCYLMLQRSFKHDEQDAQLNMDTYHFEWSDQKNSRYGGIEQFTLTPDKAEVVFDAETAELLHGMSRLLISFQLPPAEYAALRQALGHIFHDSACLLMTTSEGTG